MYHMRNSGNNLMMLAGKLSEKMTGSYCFGHLVRALGFPCLHACNQHVLCSILAWPVYFFTCHFLHLTKMMHFEPNALASFHTLVRSLPVIILDCLNCFVERFFWPEVHWFESGWMLFPNSISHSIASHVFHLFHYFLQNSKIHKK